MLRTVEEAQHVAQHPLPCAHALQLHAEAGVPGQPLPFGAQLQVEGVPGRWVQGHEQVVDGVTPSGTGGAAHRNGCLQPWHELVPEHELKNQDPSLLDTLCCGSYLDVRKTAKWFQELVAEAWGAVPQAAQLQLPMVPSSRFCKFLLTNASKDTLSIELMLGVKQDHSNTYLTFQ
ncbi:Inositol 1,4,5-trisphosphate receptor-interacting protein-like 1 [Aix galericulata]|nr:Inositol 1,4,5-trisphosphate receptor-interacting protein-like 1 [Aix galericulata]